MGIDAFSILSNVPLSSLPGSFVSTCASTKGPGDAEYTTSDSPVYQMLSSPTFSSGLCYRSGYNVYSSEHMVQNMVEAGLIDPVKPASGWYLKYNGGDTCDDVYTDSQQCATKVYQKGVTYCQRSFKFDRPLLDILYLKPTCVHIYSFLFVCLSVCL